ncbi:Hpt domain-containing protein [Dechloromonas sp. A34]|uniref:hybrid sensor histidine kinase/response regulator n=1 Tax=Dechloromonas sp. A34 TaxID=447588 RepID=UPI00224939C2|nr:Hpt domain-containing protein [Dechloromonas sp. A34]
MGPLTWVKGEIDLALQRAEEALGQYESGADATSLKFCRTHVHQVYGALSIVGLDGVTQLVESLEALLVAFEEGRLSADDSGVAVLRQVLAGLRQYLDDLMVGEPNQPLRLLPLYQALASARGQAAFHASDLFYPDLSLRPPRRAATEALAPEELKQVLKSARMGYQKGLLQMLRNPAGAESGRQMMRDALASIEAHQENPSARAFWWVALAFLEALADPALNADLSVRYLCSRIDAQIRRLLNGSNNVAERVMREALYYVAQAPADLTPLIADVQSTFALPELIPLAAASNVALPQEAALRKLREVLAATEEFWNKFCTGNAGSMAGFADNARNCAQLTEEIGQTDLKRLGQGLGAVASWLAEDPKRYSDTVAMEVATTILLLQNAQEGFKRLGTDFAQQVDLMIARLYACIAGKPASADEGIPLLDEMTRRAQEKLLIGQVGREIQNNLAQIEQSLDAFFRDPAKGHDLAQLDAPLKQVGGALAMLGHFGAVSNLNECSARIRQFADPDYQPASADFEAVAEQLSLIGFFVDSLQHGENDFDAFVRRMDGEPSPRAFEEGEFEATPAPTVEAQLAQQARETHALVEALKEAPQDLRLQDEIKQNLQAIQKDADLVANHELGETAKAALEALEAGVVPDAAVDAALSGLMPQMPAAPKPSAETLQLAESSHEEIDAELLAIFLEEAGEVLAAIGEQREILLADPHNVDALTTIRRSAHTLKGSGRMVGLTDLGETAWEMEQTLNLWLRQDQAVTPELMGMIGDAHQLFSVWVEHLESGDGLAPDTAAFVALAGRLRGVEPLPVAVLPPIPEMVSAPLEPEPSIQLIELPEPEESFDAVSMVLDLSMLDEQPAPELPVIAEAPPNEEPLHLSEAAIEIESDALLVQEELPQPVEEALPPSVTASPTLYDIFREEARGYLQTLIDSYAELDAKPLEPTTFEMTRAAHTLGGIAATVGLMPLNRLASALEHALLRRDNSAHPDSIEGLETVRQAIITLESMFAGLAQQQEPQEQSQLVAALEDVFSAPVVVPATPSPAGAEIITLPGLALEEPAVASEPIPAAPAQPVPHLTDELDEQLLPIFLEEAADQLRDLTAQLRAWRADPAGEAAPHAIARLLHTFKGNARMAGAMNLGEVTHQLETRVDEVMRGGKASPIFIDEIENGCDVLDQAVERLRAGPQEAVVEAPAVVSEAAAVASTAPAAVVVDAEHEAEGGGQRATLRVRADLIDRLVNEAGELSIARTRIEGEMRSLKTSLLDLTENVIRLRRQLREIEIQAEGQIQARVAHTPEGQAEFDPLELDRFTRFQELTRFMAESVNDVATVQQNLLKNLDDANAAILAQSRLNRGLQQELMGVRMIPFASQDERLYRIVRQTAKDVGKRANLDIVGGQVEIDRSVLDKMLAPIEHMLRNAITHGIESREQRLAAGKPEVGEITLALAQEGNEIILSLSDDGKGLDVERIRVRAEAMGLLQPGQVTEDATLLDFIFQPGFSTASELTQLAGRGVGMDVVKTEVTELGGRVEIMSRPGQGTTFRLYLPLTLAVTQTLLVRVGTHLYAVPSTMIEQVMEMKEKQLAALREKGEAEWQGNHYPLHFLSHLLGDADAVPEVRRRYWVLLLRSGSQRVAIQVDELQGNQEVVVKNIGAQLARVVGIAGATVLGDGRVVLILNPVALVSRTPVISLQSAEGAPIAAAHVEARSPTVMVVDDSLTVRKITSRLLAREGYEVILAKDGVDALEQLIDFTPDVILSDIEMPRMDGFDFVRNLRADERLKSLPVIMITSRTADKHRNYAFEIGANHYLGKPYDEEELLRLVAGFIKAKAGA